MFSTEKVIGTICSFFLFTSTLVWGGGFPNTPIDCMSSRINHSGHSPWSEDPRFLEGLYVKDLMTEDGDIILFRTQAGRYVPNQGHIGFFTRTEGGLVSTTFNPLLGWMMMPEKIPNYVVIFRQNIYRDALMYPSEERDPESKNLIRKPLTSDLPLSEIAQLDEVKVPPSKANVIAEFPPDCFESIIEKELNPKVLMINEILEKIENHPDKLAPIKDESEVKYFEHPRPHFLKM